MATWHQEAPFLDTESSRGFPHVLGRDKNLPVCLNKRRKLSYMQQAFMFQIEQQLRAADVALFPQSTE